MNPKPRIFIGSSVEGLRIAEHIQLGLDYDAECTVWSQGVFGLSGGTLESLFGAVQNIEFAALVLTPDDLVQKRDHAANSPRDNVLFELGLFMGALGRERTFIVYCRDESIRLPSDLAGVTATTFARRADGNLQAALGPVCTQIKNAIFRQRGLVAGPVAAPEATTSALAAEIATLKALLNAQTESLRQVLSAVTMAKPTAGLEGASQTQRPALSSLEGVWRAWDSRTVYHARLHSGQLRIVYCYEEDPGAIAEYYDLNIIGDTIFGRFRWLKRATMRGYVYLRVESPNRLVGGWCFEHEIPHEGIEGLPRSDNIAAMIWTRQKPGSSVPDWVEHYFDSLHTGAEYAG